MFTKQPMNRYRLRRMNNRDWQAKQIKKWGHRVPEHIEHGTEEDIRAKLKPLETSRWRMEGPGKLVCDTPQGRLVNFIPNDMICTGEDSKGNPILQKIKV